VIELGLLFTVNGMPRRWRAFSVHQTSGAMLPVWTADVDGSLGCGATLEGALLFAARAAEEGKPVELEVKP
jgi:hypothetical protein